MTLSDRLAAAAKAREQHGRWTSPASASAPRSGSTTATAERVHVIITAAQPVVAVSPDPTAAPDAVCPTCGRTGELGVVDLARRTADWNCEACGTMWRAVMPAPADGDLPPPNR